MINPSDYFSSLGNTPKPDIWSPSKAFRRSTRENTNASRQQAYETDLAIYNQNQADYRNYLMAEYSFAKNREQSEYEWERETSYNNPAAQMARLKAAGLNPNLVNASIDRGDYSAQSYTQASSSAAKPNSVARPQGSPLEDAATAMQGIQAIMGVMSQGYGLVTQQLNNSVTKQILNQKMLENQGLSLNIAEDMIRRGDYLDKDSQLSSMLREQVMATQAQQAKDALYNANASFARSDYDFGGDTYSTGSTNNYLRRLMTEDETKRTQLSMMRQAQQMQNLDKKLDVQLDKSLQGLKEPYASILRTLLKNLVSGFKSPSLNYSFK